MNPTNLPINLADARKQVELGEDDTSHDDHLVRLAKTATAEVERATRRALITQTWKLTLEDFPLEISLPRPPLQSVVIQYLNEANTLTTLASSTYQVEDETPACIELAYGKSWPVVYPDTHNAVQITYVAGFGDTHESVPDEYKNVILELLAFRFFNRGDVEAEIPKHIKWSLKSLHCGAKLGYYDIK